MLERYHNRRAVRNEDLKTEILLCVNENNKNNMEVIIRLHSRRHLLTEV